MLSSSDLKAIYAKSLASIARQISEFWAGSLHFSRIKHFSVSLASESNCDIDFLTLAKSFGWAAFFTAFSTKFANSTCLALITKLRNCYYSWFRSQKSTLLAVVGSIAIITWRVSAKSSSRIPFVNAPKIPSAYYSTGKSKSGLEFSLFSFRKSLTSTPICSSSSWGIDLL